MAITLKKDLRAQLYTHICAFLRSARVNHNYFLDWETVGNDLREADECIPAKGVLKERLVEYIHEFPTHEFVTDFISAELEDTGIFESGVECRLTELPLFADVHDTAERLLRELESLPWKYTLTLQLPNSISEGVHLENPAVELGGGISVVGGARLEASYPLLNASEIEKKRIELDVADGLPDGWQSDAAYLQINASGFIGPFEGKTPHLAALDDIKSVVGLLISIGALGVEPFWELPKQHQYLYVHREISGKHVLQGALKVPTGMSVVFQRLVPGELKNKTATVDDRKKIFSSTLKSMRQVYTEKTASENVLAATRWLFDSYATQDELLQYIQTMVVLEIILGSKKYASELSIGETISNRCAYMIGTDWQERQDILDDFKEIYAVRSQIVHRGKSRLSHAERGMLSRLQVLATRVVMEEVQRMPKPA